MEQQQQQEEGTSSLGWPFGLPTCVAIHTPSPKSSSSSSSTQAFHQQFMNLQTTFLLPFFSDVGESSSSDSDARSEAASSFFKDSRRITLGSLIGLPMDHSFHHHFDHANFHVFATTNPARPSQTFCVPIMELLRCVRNSESSEFAGFSDDQVEHEAVTAARASTAYLQSSSNGTTLEEAISNGSHSLIGTTNSSPAIASCPSILLPFRHRKSVSPSECSGMLA